MMTLLPEQGKVNQARPLPFACHTRANLRAAISSAAVSAPGGLDRASMANALSTCLQTASFYGKVADTEGLMTDAVGLQNAIPKFARTPRL